MVDCNYNCCESSALPTLSKMDSFLIIQYNISRYMLICCYAYTYAHVLLRCIVFILPALHTFC